MNTRIAYIALIVIWSTTPLAIKWSTEGPGYLFGIAGRMVLGLVVCAIVVVAIRAPMPWHGRAVRTYVACGLGIYGAMMSVYWGAQHIPSGWVSVLWGLSPIITGVLAAKLLREDALDPYRIAGLVLGLAGLATMFVHGATLGPRFVQGACAVVAGTAIHALSAVLVKRLDAQVGGFAITAGGLGFAVPLLLATWLAAGGGWPDVVPVRALVSIVYLGIVASAIGFALYFYVLSRMEVSRLSLIALITPVIALLLGHSLNGEPVGITVVAGTALILAGLGVYEMGPVIGRATARRAGAQS